MKTYLVGGAVRDQLLGRVVKEHDFVVVGSTPEEMLKRGFRPVGKDFPVFLHPETHEEYALARTERKVAKGYHGFSFYAAADVSLEDDLARRDLTINAMAQDDNGNIIDPYAGQKDLQLKILRHVSPAFAEDPVRILRVARFAARLPDFSVHVDTNQLMQQMVKNGEVDALVSERVFQEFSRALTETTPLRFFNVLKDCNALEKLFPEIDKTAEKSLQAATKVSDVSHIRFAAMLYYCDEPVIKSLCDRLNTPKQYKDLAILTARCKQHYEAALTANSEKLFVTLQMTDALRRPGRFREFLTACGINNSDLAKKIDTHLNDGLSAIKKVDIKQINLIGLTPQQIAETIKAARIQALVLINGG